jgi:hypothetical protein
MRPRRHVPRGPQDHDPLVSVWDTREEKNKCLSYQWVDVYNGDFDYLSHVHPEVMHVLREIRCDLHDGTSMAELGIQGKWYVRT